MNPSKFLSLAGLLLVTALHTACGPIPMAARSLSRVEESSRMRKAASLKAWEAGGKGRETTVKTAEIRTGLLLRWDTVEVDSHRTGGGLQWSLKLKGHSGSIASAVPVTDDGYYLTAAHCVTESSPTVVSLTKKVRMEKGPVRVVWRGRGTPGSPDLAVIHVPLKPVMPFRLAGPAAVRGGAPVAVTGWSGLARSEVKGSSAGGRVLAVSPLLRDGSGAAWRVVRHDVPLGSGDSGGPLITTDGRCAGINSKMLVTGLTVLKSWGGSTGSLNAPMEGYEGEAILPDADWLQGVIATDRRKR